MQKETDKLNDEQKIINCQTSVKYISASDVSLSNVSINASDILFSGKVDDIYAFIYFDQGDLPADAAQEQKQKKSYKTGKRAKGRDSLPKRIPIISREPYLRAISFQKNKDAYMRQIDDSKELPEIQSLRFLYGAFLLKFPVDPNTDDLEKIPDGWLDQTITIYLRDYMEAIGLGKNSGDASLEAIKKKISGYENLMGVIREEKYGLATYKEYPVVKNYFYDESDKTITFASPYIMALIRRVESARIATNKKGEPIRYEDGKFKLLPAYSCQLHPEILKEKNRRAVEITGVFATLTDRAGSPIEGEKERKVNISSSEMLERCVELKVAYEEQKTDSKKDRVLERSFKKSYKLLRTHTDLQKCYKNINLPDHKDEECIPKTEQIDKALIITHEGKIKKRGN